jgi:hypothetical protein
MYQLGIRCATTGCDNHPIVALDARAQDSAAARHPRMADTASINKE